MKQITLTAWALGVGALIAATGCSAAEAEVVADRTPHAIDDHECASCGMIVREQPSPRGQAVHRDGERVFFCSLADLVAYQAAPSRHGGRRLWFRSRPFATACSPTSAHVVASYLRLRGLSRAGVAYAPLA